MKYYQYPAICKVTKLDTILRGDLEKILRIPLREQCDSKNVERLLGKRLYWARGLRIRIIGMP